MLCAWPAMFGLIFIGTFLVVWVFWGLPGSRRAQRKCGRCGTSWSNQAKFCGRCGQKLME